MYMELSRKVMQVQPSATLKISATAKQMMADGVDVINLGIGEPDFRPRITLSKQPLIVFKMVKRVSTHRQLDYQL